MKKSGQHNKVLPVYLPYLDCSTYEGNDMASGLLKTDCNEDI